MDTPFYIVSTPIGNLGDISFRAIDILKQVDTILCEDTRVTRKLCDHYGIDTPRESYHAHSSDTASLSIIRRIEEGKTFALVSDAGTPVISDPGVKLVSDLRAHFGSTLNIVPIPGATALISALVCTGFSGNDFRFFGFVPHKKGRETFFQEIADHTSIAIFYESPHRAMKTLEYLSLDLKLSTRQLCVARELTKMYEQKVQGTPKEVLEYFTEYPEKMKGEFVFVVDRVI